MSTTPILTTLTSDANFVEIVRKTLDRSESPLSANALSKQLPPNLRSSAKKLEPRLEEMVERGEIRELPKYRGAKQYWTRELETYAREEIVRQLSERPLTRSELETKVENKLRGLSKSQRDIIFKELLERGDVQKIPRYIATTADRYSTRPADPRDYLVHAFEKVREKLTKAGISKHAIEAAACEVVQRWDREPAKDVSITSASPVSESAVPKSQRQAEPELEQTNLPAMIFSRMQEIEPRAREGAMVSIPELRRAVEFLHADRSEFDQALWSLIRSERLAVHRHDHPFGLSEAERSELLQNQAGQYYNGVSIRISS